MPDRWVDLCSRGRCSNLQSGSVVEHELAAGIGRGIRELSVLIACGGLSRGGRGREKHHILLPHDQSERARINRDRREWSARKRADQSGSKESRADDEVGGGVELIDKGLELRGGSRCLT